MLQNNNREIVRKIAFRSMKQNRIRNGIVILAVILTTFMFTTIFTIGASLAEGMVVMCAGRAADAGLPGGAVRGLRRRRRTL